MIESGCIASSGIDTVAMAIQMTKMKGKRYVFGIFEYEDIKQEIWLAVNKASGSFDPSRTLKATTFFNVATENALKNLRRDFSRTGEFVNKSDLPTDRLDYTREGLGFTIARDLYDFLYNRMPPHFRADFEDLVYRGGPNIPAAKLSKIRILVRLLVRRYNDE